MEEALECVLKFDTQAHSGAEKLFWVENKFENLFYVASGAFQLHTLL